MNHKINVLIFFFVLECYKQIQFCGFISIVLSSFQWIFFFQNCAYELITDHYKACIFFGKQLKSTNNCAIAWKIKKRGYHARSKDVDQNQQQTPKCSSYFIITYTTHTHAHMHTLVDVINIIKQMLMEIRCISMCVRHMYK